MRQWVFITGAASGIGLEIARAFSAAGATVFVTDANARRWRLRRPMYPGC